jgi:hypothetical protein
MTKVKKGFMLWLYFCIKSLHLFTINPIHSFIINLTKKIHKLIKANINCQTLQTIISIHNIDSSSVKKFLNILTTSLYTSPDLWCCSDYILYRHPGIDSNCFRIKFYPLTWLPKFNNSKRHFKPAKIALLSSSCLTRTETPSTTLLLRTIYITLSLWAELHRFLKI